MYVCVCVCVCACSFMAFILTLPANQITIYIYTLRKYTLVKITYKKFILVNQSVLFPYVYLCNNSCLSLSCLYMLLRIRHTFFYVYLRQVFLSIPDIDKVILFGDLNAKVE